MAEGYNLRKDTGAPQIYSPYDEERRHKELTKSRRNKENKPDGISGIGSPSSGECGLETKASPAAETSMLGKIIKSMNPFGKAKKGSSTRSTLSSKIAEEDEHHEEAMSTLKEEIADMQCEIQSSEAEVDSLKEIISDISTTIDPAHAMFESDKVNENKELFKRMKMELNQKKLEHSKLVAKLTREIDKKKLQLNILDKKHAVVLAHLEEEEEQRLSSEGSEDESNYLNARIESWKEKSEGAPEPAPAAAKPLEEINPVIPAPRPPPAAPAQVSNNDIAQALISQGQALAQLLDKGSSVSSDKFLARQTFGKDLPHFYGKPEEWPAFIADFERTTEMCKFSASENMQRLRKCLKGEAAKAVQCLMVSPENLEEVMETLKTRFGQSRHIIESMIKAVRSAAAIKEDKLETVIQFGTAVTNMTATIKSLKSTNHLNNPMLLEELKAKLPPSYKVQFVEWIRSDASRSEDIESFTTWIKNKMSICCELVAPTTKCEEKEPWSSKGGRRAVAVHNTDEKRGCNICGKYKHQTHQCFAFRDLTPDDRVLLAMEKKLCLNCLGVNHQARKCKNTRKCGVDKCEYLHNPLLHGARPLRDLLPGKEKQVGGGEETSFSKPQQQSNQVDHVQNDEQIHCVQSACLRYVLTEVQGPNGNQTVLAMLDEGATISMMDEELRKSLGRHGPKQSLWIKTVSDKKTLSEAQVVGVKIRGKFAGSKTFEMRNVKAVKKLNLDAVTLNVDKLKKDFPYLKNAPLQSFNNMVPKLLIGIPQYHLTKPQRYIERDANEPVAVKSLLGWSVAIFGNSVMDANTNFVGMTCEEDEESDENLHKLVKQFFTTEDFGVKPTTVSMRSKEDQRAIRLMEDSLKRGEDGVRFEVGQLWKQDDFVLPESKSNAYKRLMCQERKMDKNEDFAKAYCAKMDEYLEKGFIRKLGKEEVKKDNNKTWYLPHFGVLNPNKPGKLRFVLDCAAKSHGRSLNDYICQGPDLNNSIVSVLLRFRQFEVAYAGDVKDMFHRVFIQPEDRHSQRFLWRGMKRDCEPDVFEFKVMVFGATSSPCIAQFVKNYNADLFQETSPEAAEITKKSFYVDDCLHSAPSEETAIHNVKEVIRIQESAGFQICNWVSSSSTLLKKIPPSLLSNKLDGLDFESELPNERVLGMWWMPLEDKFSYRLNFHKVPEEIKTGEQRPTKRQLLRLVMSVYDPLGFLGHLIVKAKILLQDTWRKEISWDDEVTDEINEKWILWLQELQGITEVRISRCYSTLIPEAESIQLHVFCDSSEKAFAAVAYLRVEKNGEINVNLVSSKTRVSPMKVLSIPRLELQAALMGTRLASTIKEELDFKINRVFYWTDSTTVLKWIRSDAKNFKQFVAHRLGEILEVTEVEDWRWIPTKLNVADDATRDNQPIDLSQKSRWFNGPEFLQEDEKCWPTETIKMKPGSDEDIEENVNMVIKFDQPLINVNRFSKFIKLLRVTSLLLRIKLGKSFKKKIVPEITIAEMNEAKKFWCHQVQSDSFAEEIACLNGGKPLPKNSRLYRLEPFLDEDGLLRIQGRLSEAQLLDSAIHPIILDNRHKFTRLMISYFHEKLGHQGVQTVANELRQEYWILDSELQQSSEPLRIVKYASLEKQSR